MTRLGRMAGARNILNKNEGIINHILLLLFFIIFFFWLVFYSVLFLLLKTGWDFTECRIPNSWYMYIFLISCFFFFFLPITNFFHSALFLFCVECLAEKVKKFFSGKKDLGKVQGNDISSRVERVDAGLADH